MPIQINYLDNGTGIEIIASGIVTCEEIIKANKEIYNEWNIYKQQYQIIDCNSPVRCAAGTSPSHPKVEPTSALPAPGPGLKNMEITKRWIIN